MFLKFFAPAGVGDIIIYPHVPYYNMACAGWMNMLADIDLHLVYNVLIKCAVKVEKRQSSDVCATNYEQWLIDGDGEKIEFAKKVVLKESEEFRRLYQGAEREKMILYLATDGKERSYLVLERKVSGWSPRETWDNTILLVLPLQPMKLKVVERGVAVRCRPDGYSREYGPEVVAEYVFSY